MSLDIVPLTFESSTPCCSATAMSIAITVFAAILLAAIGRLTWGAILIGREYDAEEQSWH